MNAAFQARLNSLGTSIADVEERFIRGSGPGGQKVNKSSSTVGLRHRPTGIEVRCQRERSQSANREIAWAELCEKIAARRNLAAARRREDEERDRRRSRQKSGAQKGRMIAAKRHRSGIKAHRGRPVDD